MHIRRLIHMQLFKLRQNYKKAINYFNKGFQVYPSFSGFLVNLGLIYFDLKDYEKELLNYNTVAKDKIAVIVNQKNPLSDITLYMLKSIYTGGVKNWEDLQ